MSAASSLQNRISPTADLMPTGSPVAAATRSTKSSSESASENTVCPAGLMQSRSAGTPRMAAISGVILALRQHAADAWLGALTELDLDRADLRMGGDHRLEARQAEASVQLPAAEVAGAQLEHQVPALEVMRRQAALAGVLQAAGQFRAAVDGADRGAAQRAVAHRRHVHHRRWTERPGAAAWTAQHLGARQRIARRRSPDRRDAATAAGTPRA